MSVSYAPDAGDALFAEFAGVSFDDPAAYAAAYAKRIDAKFFLKPVQDELLNLIALGLSGGAALKVRNETGSALARGSLVYASGYSAGAGRVLVAKADADDPAKPARYVLDADLADAADGIAYAFREVAGLDTSGASAVGSAVFLSATAGAFAHAAPAGASQAVQQVGVVTAKDAAAGAVRFFPGAGIVRAAGTAWLQDAGVSAAKLSDAVSDGFARVALSVGAESSDQIDVSVQARDIQGNNLAAELLFECWLADAAAGWETSTAADALSVVTGVAADAPASNKRLRAITNASGLAVIRVAKTGAQTWYLRVACGGFVFTSGAVAFA